MYNGWKNYETWNCALWIGNDYELYTAAVEFMQNYDEETDAYRSFIQSLELNDGETPDGVPWMEEDLDYTALDSMMSELLEE